MRYPRPRSRSRNGTNSGSGPEAVLNRECTKLASVVLFLSQPPRAVHQLAGLPKSCRSHERKPSTHARDGELFSIFKLSQPVRPLDSDLDGGLGGAFASKHCSALFATVREAQQARKRGVQRFDLTPRPAFAWGMTSCRIPQLQSPERSLG